MRLATYNIWNSEAGMPKREQYIINEIINVKADIVCLQEVQDKAQAERIAYKANYKHYFFENYGDEAEGLCIISKVPLTKCNSWLDSANALFCAFTYNDKVIAVVNLHLPWEGSLKREKQITDIVEGINNEKFDYAFLAGDFNCSDTSDVQRFLIGDCSLANVEAVPHWYDLALSYADFTKANAECTMSFRENPRFKNNTIEPNARFDRILLRNTYPCELPVLKDCSIFGRKIYTDINLSASDHYGVVIEIDYE